MKKTLLTLCIILCCSSLALVAQKKPGTEVTIIGEVIDTQCYLTNALGLGNGKEHKECALSCAKGGIPLSILEEKSGTIFLAGQSKKAMAGANELLQDYIAEKVKVSGRLLEKGGVKFILIAKVDKIPQR